MDPEVRQAYMADYFSEIYKGEPEIWVRAPGRVDLMGSHTDYNMGYVMTMTVDRDTWIAARPRADRKVSIHSLNVPGEGNFELDEIIPDRVHSWTNYIRGVAKYLGEAGVTLAGFDGLIHSTVPFNSGLSSSAALEMSAAVLFSVLGGFNLDPVEMALIGQKAENLFVGVKSGILDQYSSAMGQQGCALLLDCRHLTSRDVRITPGMKVVIGDMQAKRTLVGSEYDIRRSQCETGVQELKNFYPDIQALRDVSMDMLEEHAGKLEEVVYRRCRFIIEENQRVLELETALAAGDHPALNRLYTASYQGASELYEIGAPSMDAMIDAMLSSPGVIAARQAGAGFGGCMVALVQDGSVEAFIQETSSVYQKATGITPVIFEVRPAEGAGLLKHPRR
jgi:galactokinase